MKRTIKGLFVALALFGAVIAFSGSAKAANWDPGRIIDDGKFTNNNSMSIGDIQNFLNSKVPVCDRWHSPGSGSQGEQPPWDCLKDYVENGKGAAQIIWEQAQAYNINPQVLLVTLQKENGLITDTWPYDWQYRTAMGFGCPDGAPCDAQWFGFTNQVTQAARHFRNFYDQNPSWYIPYRPGVNYIKWNPNSACGGSNVNIVNRATAALYSYTPYQPNSAALNNLYGTGDGCSSYGNRNFWRDFNNWFGSTSDGPYQWQDAGVSSSKNLNGLAPGDSVSITVTAKNIGTTTWQRDGSNQVNLATSPIGRTSQFQGSGWLNNVTPAKLNETNVSPGQNGTFTFNISVPPFQGTFYENFNLVAQGAAWFADPGFKVQITVPSGYRWSFNSQGAYTDSSKTTPVDLNNMSPGQTAWLVVKANNIGTETWYNNGANPITLATDRSPARVSRYATNQWINNVTPTILKESSVLPGQVGSFEFPIQVPAGQVTGQEYFNLIAQGKIWFNQDVGQFFPITVKHDYRWAYAGQGAYTDSSKTTTVDLNNMSPGQTAWLVVKAKNIGQTAWYRDNTNQINLVTDNSFARTSRFVAPGWVNNQNTPAKMLENHVATNQVATFEFPIKVPPGAGAFKEYFNPIAQGISQMNNNIGQFFPINVKHDYRWAYAGQGAYTDSSKATTVDLNNMSPGQTAWLVVKAKNIGQTAWYKTGPNRVDLATDRQAGRVSRFATGAWANAATPASLVESVVFPGQTGTYEFPIQIPVGAGSYQEYFNPVSQGIMFLNNDVGQFFNIKVN